MIQKSRIDTPPMICSQSSIGRKNLAYVQSRCPNPPQTRPHFLESHLHLVEDSNNMNRLGKNISYIPGERFLLS